MRQDMQLLPRNLLLGILLHHDDSTYQYELRFLYELRQSCNADGRRTHE